MISNFDRSPDFFAGKFEQYLKQTKIPNKSIFELTKKLRKNVDLLVKKRKYLVAGQIQSGKTNYFIGLLCNIFDNKSNFCFIVCGNDNEIYHQTNERIEKLIYLDFTMKEEIKFFTKIDLKNPEIVKQINTSLQNNKKIIITSIKNQNN